MALPEHVYRLPVRVEGDSRERTFNPVAVETPHGLLLLDTGLPGVTDELEAALRDHGKSFEDVASIVVTHHDADHVGCLASVAERTDALVFAHEDGVPYVEGEEEPVKSTEERPISYPGTPVDVQLVGGERFRTVAGPLLAVHTPGHAPGHTSFYSPESKLLVTADALNVEGDHLVGPRERFTPDMETAWASVERLAELDVDHALCYHGGYVEEGSEEIRALLDGRD